jgi:hypothetical protein
MRREPSLSPKDWSRLESLWESVRGLPPDQRDDMLASHAVDGALRDELESLLGSRERRRSVLRPVADGRPEDRPRFIGAA